MKNTTEITVMVPRCYVIERDDQGIIKDVRCGGFSIESMFKGTVTTDEELRKFWQDKADQAGL